ncbi:MAG: hypothetical protein WDZ94_05510 [Patescibacteria group bacterium]
MLHENLTSELTDQHGQQKALHKWLQYFAILVGAVVIFGAGYGAAKYASPSEQNPSTSTGEPHPADEETTDPSPILRPKEKLAYQIIANQQVLVYFDTEYGFDVEPTSELEKISTEQFPDLEQDLERFLNTFDFFVDELASLAVAVDPETQRLYAAMEVKVGQVLTAVFLAESDRYGADFNMSAFDVAIHDGSMAQAYADLDVLGFFPSQRAILIRKSSGGIPCVQHRFELLYQDGTAQAVAEIDEGSCDGESSALLSFDGTYLYIADVVEADAEFDLFIKGANVPRSRVTAAYKLNPLTGERVASSQDFSQEVWLLPEYANSAQLGYHSSILYTQHVGEQDEFLQPGGILLERASSTEHVFLEI